MSRRKRPVILRKDRAVKQFDSIKEAAAFLGVCPANIGTVLRGHDRHHTIRGFYVEYVDIQEPQNPPTKRGKPVAPRQYEAEIDGVVFVSEDGSNEPNCTTCDIYKMRPPIYMTMQPLCCENTCTKAHHKIVDLCAAYDLVWKKKK